MDPRHRTWASSERFVPRTFIRPFVRFSRIEAASGIVLLLAAAAALVWANSPWSDTYFRLLDEPLSIRFFDFHFEQTVLHLINDGLMAIFFFVVGLEIKRELVAGDLRDRRAAALPVLAALGGMLVPAAIYVAFNAGTGAVSGWGVPMATDIAFAVGVVALLGSRIPAGAKLFLLAVAIADDIGAIVVIALFYTGRIETGFLAAAAAGAALVWVASRVHIRTMWFYVPMALVAWFFTLESGVHATLAGVVLGFITPARPYYEPRQFDVMARAILDQYPVHDFSEQRLQEHADHEALLLSEIASEAVAPLNRIAFRLVKWSSFVIVPLFALANAGVDFRGVNLGESVTSRVALGVSLGLVVGKIVGITSFSWLAVRLGIGRLPAGTSWSHVVGLASVAGIGFTVALFVTGLAFTDPALADLSKTGIFTASIVAGTIGALLLSRARPASDL
jgi:Na+:H+ antiporter, NhaA family